MIDTRLHISIDTAPFVWVTDKSINHRQSILAWALSDSFNNISHIQLESVLQYLTTMEADTMLLNIFNSLRIGGTLEIICDDFDTVISQWQSARWDEESIRNANSDARQAFAKLFGPQQSGNPTQANYNRGYPDTFKSAYNKNRLHFLLERVGFVDVVVNVVDGTLLGSGSKTMQRGERQIAKNLSGIRPDHINRYTFACEQLKLHQPAAVLDLACGIGYGTALLAEALKCQVVGIDIDEGAIQFARKHYSVDGASFIQADARIVDLAPATFDAVVSFETIEHVPFDLELLQKFCHLLKPGGTLIVSTPNQDVMPFDKIKFKYHLKHYTVTEFIGLVKQAGFNVVECYQQIDPHGGSVEPGSNGAFTILVCAKS